MARMTKKLREQIIQLRIERLCEPCRCVSRLVLFAPEQHELVSRVHASFIDQCPEMKLVFGKEHEAKYNRDDFEIVSTYVEFKSPSEYQDDVMASYLWYSFFKMLLTCLLKGTLLMEKRLVWAKDCIVLREHPEQWEREMYELSEQYERLEKPYWMLVDFFDEMTKPPVMDKFFRGCFQALLMLRSHKGFSHNVEIRVLCNTDFDGSCFNFPDGSKVFATHTDFTDLKPKRRKLDGNH